MLIWVLAVLIGALAGFIIPGSWWIFEKIGEGIGLLGTEPAQNWQYCLYLPFAMAAIVYVLNYFFRASRSADGFTYFISDLHFQDGRRKLRFSLVHGLASFALSVGQGIVGIEGFCLEFLSALGSRLGSWFDLSANQIRTLAACGATATMAALLGQPVAALLFVVEVLYGWGSISFAIGAYAVTAFMATSVAQSLKSTKGIFHTVLGFDASYIFSVRGDYFEISFETAVACFVLVGLGSALLAILVIWTTQRTDKELHHLFESKRGEQLSHKAFACRLLLWASLTSFSLYFFTNSLGQGVSILKDSLSEEFPLKLAVLLLFLRIFMGAISYSVIGSMGLILPNLVIGGLLGASISIAVKSLFPLSGGTFALLGMGAYFSASFGTPVAATALVFGLASGLLSESALFLFTALTTNFLAHYLCGFVFSDRLCTIGLYRHGIRFRDGMCFNTLSGIQVKDAMIRNIAPIAKENSIGDAYKLVMDSRFSQLPVVEGEKYLGMVSLADFYGLETWRRLDSGSQVHNLVGVEEMMKTTHVHVNPEMNLESALEHMHDEEIVPVLEGEH